MLAGILIRLFYTMIVRDVHSFFYLWRPVKWSSACLTPGYLLVEFVSLILFTDRPGLKEVLEIQKLRDKITSSLKMEIGLNHPGNEELVTKVLHQIPIMRGLSLQHVSVLNKFKQTEPDMEFPALHKELFSIEGTESSWGTAGPVHWREKILFPWLRIVHEIWLGLVHKIACGIGFFFIRKTKTVYWRRYTHRRKKKKNIKNAFYHNGLHFIFIQSENVLQGFTSANQRQCQGICRLYPSGLNQSQCLC